MVTIEESVAQAVARSPAGKRAARQARAQVKVTLNEAALDEATLGMAEGLYALGIDIAAVASVLAHRDPVAAAARGVAMMADTAFVTVWAAGVQVLGPAMAKPKRTVATGGGAVRAGAREAVMMVGFTSPLAHFNELGTVKMVAQPFLTPALNREMPSTAGHVLPAVGKRIAAAPDVP